ncbi:hypothetical protein KKB43_05385 [Patescibacteria group bacterium]|nr:hypothetical protein [Patescibacteria group bacterium]
MENNKNQKSIKESILSVIKSGQVKMTPRWHFALKASLAAFGVIILVLTVLYLASFIIFVLRQTGVLFVPAFGLQGWFAFFTNLPIFLIGLLIVFIIVLELLVRHYAFAYRRQLLYSAVGIFILVFAGVMVIENTSFHGGMSKYAEKNRETYVGKFYSEYGRQRFIDVHRGQITTMNNNGFMMRNRREEILTIVVSRRTRLPLGADFSRGDIVVVFGSRDSNLVQAFGIQEIEGE